MRVRSVRWAVLVAACGCGSSVGGGGSTDATGGSSGAGASGSASGAGPGYGERCDDGTCGVGFCDFELNHCDPIPDDGSVCSGDPGYCHSLETSCAPESEPVCGCDGAVHESLCAAHAAGVDVGDELCAPEVTPPGFFPCGIRFCDPSSSYCLALLGDTCDYHYLCEPLPAACAALSDPDCGCFTLMEFDSCSTVSGNAVTGLRIDTSAI